MSIEREIDKIPDRVKRGADLLDQRMPGWAQTVNLSVFKIVSCDRCVLGQLAGVSDQNLDYGRLARELGVGHYSEQVEHGFELILCGRTPPLHAYELALNKAWISLIQARQISDKPAEVGCGR